MHRAVCKRCKDARRADQKKREFVQTSHKSVGSRQWQKAVKPISSSTVYPASCLLPSAYCLLISKSSYQNVPEIGHSSPQYARPVLMLIPLQFCGVVNSTAISCQSFVPVGNACDLTIN